MKKQLLTLLLSITIYFGAFAQTKPNKDCPPGHSLVLIEKNWRCEPMTPLPVTLIDFTARSMGEGVILEWFVASEVNHSHYEVEHSLDGLKFAKIGTTTGYKLTHNPTEFQNYYRLVSVDLDGTRNHYKIVSAQVNASHFKVYALDGTFLGNFTWSQIPRNRAVIIGKGKYLIIANY